MLLLITYLKVHKPLHSLCSVGYVLFGGFFFFCRAARGILVPQPGMNQWPLQGKRGVPTTGQPGKSLHGIWCQNNIVLLKEGFVLSQVPHLNLDISLLYHLEDSLRK